MYLYLSAAPLSLKVHTFSHQIFLSCFIIQTFDLISIHEIYWIVLNLSVHSSNIVIK